VNAVWLQNVEDILSDALLLLLLLLLQLLLLVVFVNLENIRSLQVVCDIVDGHTLAPTPRPRATVQRSLQSWLLS
jgi:hypothetical protein